MQSRIRSLFSEHGVALAEVSRSARQAEVLIEAISPLIEAYTSAVCPDCTSVCCINRHARFDQSDVIFMTALEKDIPGENPGIADTDACRFLGSRGCNLKRSQRPYRCTWFFCSLLLDQIMQQTSAAEYREFIELLRDITKIRTKMMHDFETIFATSSPCLKTPKKNN